MTGNSNDVLRRNRPDNSCPLFGEAGAAGQQLKNGGGVLGIALVGYIYALESIGVRFLSIGGTSAGSIVALMLAAIGRPNEAKANQIIQLIADMPLASFVDGDQDAKDFIDWLVNRAGSRRQGLGLEEDPGRLRGATPHAERAGRVE